MILSALALILFSLQTVPLPKILAAGTMECCQGLAHGSNSCAIGMCSMASNPKPKRKSVKEICGAKEFSEQHSLFANFQELQQQSRFFNVESDNLSKQSDISHLDNYVFSSSCASNCCLDTVNRNQRAVISTSAVAEFTQKTRPPTEIVENNFTQSFIKICTSLHRECNPRAPPTVVS